MRVAVIPARGGSKRIPRKNIRSFNGKPMIAWSVEAAIASGCFDAVYVSTDDAETAEVARLSGAEVPFIRPPELSDDHTGTVPVIKHAVKWALDNNLPVEEACCIYATAPFVQAQDIAKAYEILTREGCDYVFPVTTFDFPIWRAVSVTPSGRLEMLNPQFYASRSQDLKEALHDCGQFYWGRRDAWLAEVPIFSPGAAPLVIPRYRVQDIDTEEDWAYAEIIFDLLKHRNFH